MSKARTRNIASAVRQANTAQPPSLDGLTTGAPAATEPSGPAGPQRPRRHREGQRGILVYVSPTVHKRLKQRAMDTDMSLQDLCATAVVQILDTQPNK